MGAQDEYLRNFCILLTDKGVVPLTDPLQIAVYQSLQEGMKRPSDLTSELNLSSSSLHFIIDKMSESGIIDRTKPESDKKTVYYSTCAKLLACSKDITDNVKDTSQRTFEDPLKNYKGLSSLSNMLDCYASEIGLDVTPLKKNYANALADAINPNKCGIEDAILDARDAFVNLTGFNFSVFSFSPLTLVVTGDEAIMERGPTLMQFIIRMVENSTGKTYKVTKIEPFNGSETMIKVSMDRCEKETEPYLNTSLFHKDTERFMMIDVDGVAGLMTSDVQISIIDSIYERPLCITDIVNKVDAPRSTITSNLLRMVEEGVISVFYSESGAAYYGLACSILVKKSRAVSSDNDEINKALFSVKDKEGGFMEGQLLYTLAYLKKLGFDSQYLMVVLGAKYMRAAGSTEKGNFDTYFGQMSEIAQAIGLSLSIVSVYPLTIGITSADPESEMSQAMTFITGMAHQGLEMASSGIFVRSTESKEQDEKVSFKEIYPALTMNPVKGVVVEDLAPAPKKRTSSVKTALFNRSRKENGRPTRTVRYITAVAILLMFSAVLVFGLPHATTDVTDAGSFTLSLDEGLTDITVYDAGGVALEFPYEISTGATVTIVSGSQINLGYLSNGIARLIEPGNDGNYTITMTSNIFLEELYDISFLEDMDCSFSIYSPDKSILTDSGTYKAKSGGLFVSANNKIKIIANEGFYIASGGEVEDDGYLQVFVCDKDKCKVITTEAMPPATKTIDLGKDEYFYGDQIVKGEFSVDANTTSIELKYAGDKNVIIKLNGTPVQLDHDNCFILQLIPGEMHLTSEETGLY